MVLACSVLLGACSLQTTGALKGNLHLHATFGDVQDLVTGEAVEISDVQVGSVIAIKLDGYQAAVTMAIKSSQKVPQGTVAVLSQTTLLGEQYIDLRLPAHFDPVAGPWVHTGEQLPTVERQGIEAFASEAASVVGALASGDLADAVRALSEGLGGRGPELNQVIKDLATVAHTVAGQRRDLGAVIDNAGKIGSALSAGHDQIGSLVDELAKATGVLAQDRQKLTTSLDELTHLAGDLNSEVIGPHLQQVETLVAQLDPVLAEAVSSKSSLEDLITGLRKFVDKVPTTQYGDSLLFFAWFSGLIGANGAVTPLLKNGPSLTALLDPRVG